MRTSEVEGSKCISFAEDPIESFSYLADSESEHDEPVRPIRPAKPTHIQKLLRAEAKRTRCEADEDVVSGSRQCSLTSA